MEKLLKTMMVMAVGSILILAISAAPARAQLSTFTALLNSGQEPPPNTNTSNAFGVAFMTLDGITGELCFSITYTDERLTSAETAAHFHAPAPPGVNAGVIIPLPPGSPKNGCVTLAEGQADLFFAGLVYINVHTANNPGGEIRGQVQTTFISY